MNDRGERDEFLNGDKKKNVKSFQNLRDKRSPSSKKYNHIYPSINYTR